MFEPAEAHFRRSMRELAQRGGAATKRRAAADPGYYSAIGRMGGLASAKARRDKSAPLDEQPFPPPLATAAETVIETEPPEQHLTDSEAALCELSAFRTNEERRAYLDGYREIRRQLGFVD